ncbi:hypothetical protein QFZ52_001400 [Arthrobacter woluwensis]|uniref:VOC family protein n=1 Tax=Arthrobacter woluwensis TaxID=156980 RepID=UPI0027828166|nr:VOC family protein [Arthrobacter woluwensis]MDQ0708748.1 hypothetical protein [Arthrobacter woluwensis]
MPIFHHLELWTRDLSGAEPSFDWLLSRLGFVKDDPADWPQGRIWRHPEGSYLVLEQSPAVLDAPHDRFRPGLNHLALTVPGRDLLDELRRDAESHGWQELFPEAYPHAGGPQHTALYLVNGQGFEVELVA